MPFRPALVKRPARVPVVVVKKATLTADEVADLGCVSRWTLNQHRRSGLIHGALMGRQYIFAADDVCAYLNERAAGAMTFVTEAALEDAE